MVELWLGIKVGLELGFGSGEVFCVGEAMQIKDSAGGGLIMIGFSVWQETPLIFLDFEDESSSSRALIFFSNFIFSLSSQPNSAFKLLISVLNSFFNSTFSSLNLILVSANSTFNLFVILSKLLLLTFKS